MYNNRFQSTINLYNTIYKEDKSNRIRINQLINNNCKFIDN